MGDKRHPSYLKGPGTESIYLTILNGSANTASGSKMGLPLLATGSKFRAAYLFLRVSSLSILSRLKTISTSVIHTTFSRLCLDYH